MLGQQERLRPVLQDLLDLAAFSLHTGTRGSPACQPLIAFAFMHEMRLREWTPPASADWANNQQHWVNAQTSSWAWNTAVAIEVVPVAAELVVRWNAVRCSLSCRLAMEPERSAL